jgi:hypothetical protein
MESSKTIGRIIGLLLLIQLIIGIAVNFVMIMPVYSAPGFLINAAEYTMQIRVSVLMALILGLISLAIALFSLKAFKKYSLTMALLFLALTVVGFSITAFENASLLSMLSLSNLNLASDDITWIAIKSFKNAAHYISLIISGLSLLVFYLILFRFNLVPKVFSILGLTASSLQLVAVSMPILGYSIIMLMIAPMALSHLSISLWLIIKGLKPRIDSVDAS